MIINKSTLLEFIKAYSRGYPKITGLAPFSSGEEEYHFLYSYWVSSWVTIRGIDEHQCTLIMAVNVSQFSSICQVVRCQVVNINATVLYCKYSNWGSNNDNTLAFCESVSYSTTIYNGIFNAGLQFFACSLY